MKKTNKNISNLETVQIEGTVGNRQCRDVGFLLLFFSFTGGMGFVAWRAYMSGNPLRIIYGTDSWGNLCFQNNEVIPGISFSGQNLKNAKYLYFFNDNMVDSKTPNYTASKSIRVCVKSCPVSPIPSIEELRNFTANTGSSLCQYGVQASQYLTNDSNGVPVCPPLPIAKQHVILNRCVPESITKRIGYMWSAVNSIFNAFDDNLIEKTVSDVKSVWRELLWLFAITLGIAFTLVVALQFLAGYIIWIIVAALVLGTLAASSVCWSILTLDGSKVRRVYLGARKRYYFYEAKVNFDSTKETDRTLELENQVRDWLIGAACLTFVTVVVMVILLVIRRHIKLVVELFKEAGKAITTMPFLLLQPILTFACLSVTAVVLGFMFLFVETAGHLIPDIQTGMVTLETDTLLKVCQINKTESAVLAAA